MNDPFVRKGISLDRLSSFVHVAELGSIAQAAPGNVVRQSLLSRQIREIEAALGTTLFERRGRRLFLTDAGKRLAEACRLMRKVLLDVEAEQKGATPEFVLAAGDSVLRWWVLPRLANGTEGVRLELMALSSEIAAARVAQGQVDLAIIRNEHQRAEVDGCSLGAIEYALFAPYALMEKRAPSVEEILMTLPFVMVSSEPALMQPAEAMRRPMSGSFSPGLVCETFPQACCAVATGQYAAILPTLARKELPEAHYYQGTTSAIANLSTQVCLIWQRKARPVRRGLHEIINTLKNILTNHI